MAAGLRSAGKWQRCIFSKHTVHLGFMYSNNRLAAVKLALDSLSVVGWMMDDKSSGATRNQRQGYAAEEKAGSGAIRKRPPSPASDGGRQQNWTLN